MSGYPRADILGTVGRAAMQTLAEKDVPARLLVRSEARAARLPGRVEPIVGDLRDEAAVAGALRGIRAALLVAPHDEEEVRIVERFVAACERSGAPGLHGRGRRPRRPDARRRPHPHPAIADRSPRLR